MRADYKEKVSLIQRVLTNTTMTRTELHNTVEMPKSTLNRLLLNMVRQGHLAEVNGEYMNMGNYWVLTIREEMRGNGPGIQCS